jgi:hypothetical protein
VAIGNLDISNCGRSAVLVDLPKPSHSVNMLYFSLHHNNGQRGAGLNVVTGEAFLNYVDMSDNRASGNGGGLFVGRNACVTFLDRLSNHPEDSSQPRFSFTHNWAKGKGGAVYLDNPYCRYDADVDRSRILYVRDATFSNNTAQHAGGAVYVFSGNPVLLESAAQTYALRTQALDLGFLRAEFVGNTVGVHTDRTRSTPLARHQPAHAELMKSCCRTFRTQSW